MLIDQKDISKHDMLEYLEYGKMKKETLEIFGAKFYVNDDLAILRNVILLRRAYGTYTIAHNGTLSTLARNPVVTDDIKIEITLSILDTDEEKLLRLEQLIKGW